MPWFPKDTRTRIQKLVGNILKVGPVPEHVAFIMDGNRRYAKMKSIEKSQGHMLGFDALAQTLEWCLDLGIKTVTVYAFSIENFKRSKEEVDCLMNLASEKFRELLKERAKIDENGVRFNILGDLTLLSDELQHLCAEVMLLSRHNHRVTLNVCFAYTSRHELTVAANELREGVQRQLLQPTDITEDLVDRCLLTNASSHPDLLVRTSGEVRLSDFLLWQSSFSVLSFVRVLWPEFSVWNFYACILNYQLNHEAVMKLRNQRDRLLTEKYSQECIQAVLQNNRTNGHELSEFRIAKLAAECKRSRDQRIDEFVTWLNEKRELQLQEMYNKYPPSSSTMHCPPALSVSSSSETVNE